MSMKNHDTRRKVLVSKIAAFVMVITFVLEGMIIFGALQVDSATIARVAPRAYEPFLKLVGEHPSSQSHPVTEDTGSKDTSTMDVMSGFTADTLLEDTNELDTGRDADLPGQPKQSTTIPEVEEPQDDGAADAVPVG